MYIIRDIETGRITGVAKATVSDKEGYMFEEAKLIRIGKCQRCKDTKILYAKRKCKACWVTVQRKKMEMKKNLRCKDCDKRICSNNNTGFCPSCVRKGERCHKWKGGISLKYAVKNKKLTHCERCHSKRNLDLHHIDRDRKHNLIANLETLCRSCHKKEHINEPEHKVHQYENNNKCKTG